MTAVAAQSRIPFLTAHAVTRYVQRVLGVDLGLDEDDFGRGFCASLHCYAAGIGVADVERALLTPAIVAAVASGATRVRYGGFWLVTKNGAIVTLAFEQDARQRPKRMKRNLSRRERRQKANRDARRTVRA